MGSFWNLGGFLGNLNLRSSKRRKTDENEMTQAASHAESPLDGQEQQAQPHQSVAETLHMNGHATMEPVQGRSQQPFAMTAGTELITGTDSMSAFGCPRPVATGPCVSQTFQQRLQDLSITSYSSAVPAGFRQPHAVQQPSQALPTQPLIQATSHAPAATSSHATQQHVPEGQRRSWVVKVNQPTSLRQAQPSTGQALQLPPSQAAQPAAPLATQQPLPQLQPIQASTSQTVQPFVDRLAQPFPGHWSKAHVRPAPQPVVQHLALAPPSGVKPRQLDFQARSTHSTPAPSAKEPPGLAHASSDAGPAAQEQLHTQHVPQQPLLSSQNYMPYLAGSFPQAFGRTATNLGSRKADQQLQSYKRYKERLEAEREATQRREHMALMAATRMQMQQQRSAWQPAWSRSEAGHDQARGSGTSLPGGAATTAATPLEPAGTSTALPRATPHVGAELAGGAGRHAASPAPLLGYGSPISPGRGGQSDMDRAIQADEEAAARADEQNKVLQAQTDALLRRMNQTMQLSVPPAGPSAGIAASEFEKKAALARKRQQHDQAVALIHAQTEQRTRDIAQQAQAVQQKLPQKPPPEEEEDEVIILESDEEEEAVVAPADEEEEFMEEEEEEESHAEDEEEEDEDYKEEQVGVPRSTPQELTYWQDLMRRNEAPATLVAEHARSCLPLTLHSMRTLKDGVWLNDEIINVSMALMQERDWQLSQQPGGRPKGAPRCHYFSSFFLNKLHKDSGVYSFKEVSRWTKTAKIKKYGQACSAVLDCDLLLFPVHVGKSHWACACIDLKRRRLMYWDSMNTTGRAPPVLGHLARWVVDEAEDKLGRGTEAAASWADAPRWPREALTSVPQQHNGCDCGVFAIMFAAYGGAGRAFDFSQKDMPAVRRRLLYDLAHLRWTIT